MNTIAITAAFESILDQIDTQRRQRDQQEKDEQAFWRAQHNAFTKAQSHFTDGVLPRWTGMSYLVKSATRPESIVHRVRRLGDVWLCSCEATGYCWHCALVTAVEQAEPAQQDDAIKAMAELF